MKNPSWLLLSWENRGHLNSHDRHDHLSPSDCSAGQLWEIILIIHQYIYLHIKPNTTFTTNNDLTFGHAYRHTFFTYPGHVFFTFNPTVNPVRLSGALHSHPKPSLTTCVVCEEMPLGLLKKSRSAPVKRLFNRISAECFCDRCTADESITELNIAV